MIIQDFAASLSRYNVRKITEHAFRTTVTIAKNKMLVLERKNEKFTLELVDNASNSWHTIREREFSSEKLLLLVLHAYLYSTLSRKGAKKYRLVKMSDSAKAIYECIKLADNKFISVEEFAQLTSLSTATVHRALQELREAGFLENNSRRGGKTTYHVIKE